MEGLRAIDKHTSPVVLAPLLQSLYHLEHLILQFIGRGRVEKPRAARPFRCSTSEPGQSRLNKSAICHRRLEIYENSHGKAWNSSGEGRVYLRWHFSRHVCLAFFHLGANQDGSKPRAREKRKNAQRWSCNFCIIYRQLRNLRSLRQSTERGVMWSTSK